MADPIILFFLHEPSTTQGEKTNWFRFFEIVRQIVEIVVLKLLFEHLKTRFTYGIFSKARQSISYIKNVASVLDEKLIELVF